MSLQDKQTENILESRFRSQVKTVALSRRTTCLGFLRVLQSRDSASAEQESTCAGRVREAVRDTESNSPARIEHAVICPGELDQTHLRSVEGGKSYIKRMK